jgi:hypothetical protein
MANRLQITAYNVRDAKGRLVAVIRFYPSPAGRMTCSAVDWDDADSWRRWQLGWGETEMAGATARRWLQSHEAAHR